jgi:hypothetical protein
MKGCWFQPTISEVERKFFPADHNGDLRAKFRYYLQPILGFAGFALADPDPALEIRLAARTIGFPIVCAD